MFSGIGESIRNSVSEQCTYFCGFPKTIRLLIVEQTIAGSTAGYNFSLLLPYTSISITATAIGLIIGANSAFKAERKKRDVRVREQDYHEDYMEREERNVAIAKKSHAEVNKAEQKAIAVAKALTEKSDAETSNKTDYLQDQIDAANRDFKNNIIGQSLLQIKLKSIEAQRVRQTHKTFASEHRETAKIRSETLLSKIEELKSKIQIKEKNENTLGSPGFSAVVMPKNKATPSWYSSFLKICSFIPDILGGGAKGFIGTSSYSYVIFSNAMGADYMAIKVLVPTILAGAAGFVRGGIAGYTEHQKEVLAKQKHANFKKKKKEQKATHAIFKAVRDEAKALQYDMKHPPVETRATSSISMSSSDSEVEQKSPIPPLATFPEVAEEVSTPKPTTRSFSDVVVSTMRRFSQPGLKVESIQKNQDTLTGIVVDTSITQQDSLNSKSTFPSLQVGKIESDEYPNELTSRPSSEGIIIPLPPLKRTLSKFQGEKPLLSKEKSMATVPASPASPSFLNAPGEIARPRSPSPVGSGRPSSPSTPQGSGRSRAATPTRSGTVINKSGFFSPNGKGKGK